MKITKISLLALAFSLTFFSCSQEDVQIAPETASSSNLRTGGITAAKVTELKNQCAAISKSALYISKKAKSDKFIDMMNNNFSSSWTSKSTFQAWLTNNLSLTKYKDVQEGLAGYDAVITSTKQFYVANQSFYNSLWQASTGQIKVILTPIIIDPAVPEQSTNSCDDDCLDDYQDSIDLALDVWIGDMEFGDYSGQSHYYALADSHFSFFMQAAEDAVWNCFGNCD